MEGCRNREVGSRQKNEEEGRREKGKEWKMRKGK